MAQTPDIRNGFKSWVDYGRPYFLRRTWTLPTNQAGILTRFVAVVFTLAIVFLYLLIERLLELYLSDSWQETQLTSHQPALNVGADDTPIEGDERINISEKDVYFYKENSLEAGKNGRESLMSPLTREWYTSERIMQRGFSIKTLRVVTTQHMRFIINTAYMATNPNLWCLPKMWAPWKLLLARLCIAVGFLLVLIGLPTTAIYITQLAMDGRSLSASPKCGQWEVSENLDLASMSSPFWQLQEMEAASYARRCYNASPGSEGCNFFLTSKIDFEERNNDTCPFASGLCLEGDSAAYTLSTGLVKAQDLGINVPVGWTFNRSTTCAPLRKLGYRSVNEKYIEHQYGHNRAFNDNTTLLELLPSSWYQTSSVYSVHLAKHTKNMTENVTSSWQPLPEFLTEINQVITLLLISGSFLHREYRSDPIFPAGTAVTYDGKTYWMNKDGLAGVLACVDRTSICTAAGDKCWGLHDSHEDITEGPLQILALNMLRISLFRSTVLHSVKLRGGAGLDASTKRFADISYPLAAEQWKAEARHLFAASLARIQISLRDYLRGSAADEPGFVNMMPAEAAEACNLFVFRGVGWVNVSVWGFYTALVSSFAVFGLVFGLGLPRSGSMVRL